MKNNEGKLIRYVAASLDGNFYQFTTYIDNFMGKCISDTL